MGIFRSKWILVPLSVALIFGFMGAGVALANETGFTFVGEDEIESVSLVAPAEVKVVTQYVPQYIEVIKYVELPPEIIHETITETIEVQVALEFGEFDTLEGFEQWRDDNLLIEIQGKKHRLPTDSFSEDYDCDDVAEAWQREALSDGYLMSIQVIDNAVLLGKRVSETHKKHAGCLTMIENGVYYLDTFSPYDITKIINRD